MLEIFLKFQDRHGVAVTYHRLGVVAQEQGRFEEGRGELPADAGDLPRLERPCSDSIGASTLGRIIADLDRHTEAVEILLFAAVS